jgi:hypothetical protein
MTHFVRFFEEYKTIVTDKVLLLVSKEFLLSLSYLVHHLRLKARVKVLPIVHIGPPLFEAKMPPKSVKKSEAFSFLLIIC